MTDGRKQAFVAGFMATGEGYNGEYPGSLSNSAEDEATKQYEIWACGRDGGHNWGPWECKDARHGDRVRCERTCRNCPEADWEFREASDQ
jgi:hypothetical protein